MSQFCLIFVRQKEVAKYSCFHYLVNYNIMLQMELANKDSQIMTAEQQKELDLLLSWSTQEDDAIISSAAAVNERAQNSAMSLDIGSLLNTEKYATHSNLKLFMIHPNLEDYKLNGRKLQTKVTQIWVNKKPFLLDPRNVALLAKWDIFKARLKTEYPHLVVAKDGLPVVSEQTMYMQFGIFLQESKTKTRMIEEYDKVERKMVSITVPALEVHSFTMSDDGDPIDSGFVNVRSQPIDDLKKSWFKAGHKATEATWLRGVDTGVKHGDKTIKINVPMYYTHPVMGAIQIFEHNKKKKLDKVYMVSDMALDNMLVVKDGDGFVNTELGDEVLTILAAHAPIEMREKMVSYLAKNKMDLLTYMSKITRLPSIFDFYDGTFLTEATFDTVLVNLIEALKTGGVSENAPVVGSAFSKPIVTPPVVQNGKMTDFEDATVVEDTLGADDSEVSSDDIPF